MSTSSRALAAVLIAALGVVLLIPGGATAVKKKPLPALLTYKAMLHVAGGVTFTSHRDTFKTCLPGQRWTMQEKGDVNIRDNILIETYKNETVRSSVAVKAGGAKSDNETPSYEESNYCPPDEPTDTLEMPHCTSLTGKGAADLGGDARNGPSRVSIAIGRPTGGNQEGNCMWALGSNATPMGSAVAPLHTVYDSIVLPLDITVKQVRNLGVKKSLIRIIHIGGTCAEPVVYRGKKIESDTTDMKDGDCVVDGDFNVTIKRLNRISKQGVPVN